MLYILRFLMSITPSMGFTILTGLYVDDGIISWIFHKFDDGFLWTDLLNLIYCYRDIKLSN